MRILKVNEARENFLQIMKEVNQLEQPVLVKGRKRSEDVVIMSDNFYKDLQETLYLLSIPGANCRIMKLH